MKEKVINRINGEQEYIPRVSKDALDTEILQRAIILVRENHKASTSFLQMKLKIGYGRAARILEELEQDGIVGPLNGIKREVLI